MDLNYLLHRHQVSLMHAEAAMCIESRHAHRTLAGRYADQIDDFRNVRRLPRLRRALSAAIVVKSHR